MASGRIKQFENSFMVLEMKHNCLGSRDQDQWNWTDGPHSKLRFSWILISAFISLVILVIYSVFVISRKAKILDIQWQSSLTSIPCCSRIAPLVFTQQYKLTKGTRKRRDPIRQELAVPAASAFCPNVMRGQYIVSKPEKFALTKSIA